MSKSKPAARKSSTQAVSADLAPPRKVSEVKAWVMAHGKNPRALAVLSKQPKRNASTAAACIRALAAIGGAKALDALATYRGEEQEGAFGGTFPDAVGAELIAAWRKFDRAEFARRLFAQTLRIEHAATLDSLEGIDSVAGLEELRVLVADGCSLEPIGRCSTLRRLSIAALGEVDVSPLARLSQLERLELRGDAIRSLEPLRDLPVRRLRISFGPHASFAFLEGLPKVERVLLAAEREKLSAEELRILKGLVERGVAICTYGHQPWTTVMKDLGGTLTEVAGFRAVGNEDLRATLELNSFV